ncbi:hypothetical protein BN946_scf184756.g23 [Trametes cinnabarina]|uniref:Uncharacterized protein n=1 Tax=Pycnoporus cinnabarinus TaxID=5643 RepID=A0A060S8S7_PYCCI|nr:hypothetical protein BN946_scf184756.g23 [Trametes cinnabarina]
MADDYVEINQVASGPTPEVPRQPESAESAVAAATAIAQAEHTHGLNPTSPDDFQNCRCWSHFKTALDRPATLDQALDPVRGSYKQSLVRIRSKIICIADDILHESSDQAARDSEVLALARRNSLLSLWPVMTEGIDHAIRTIYSIPGLFIPQPDCKHTVKGHLAILIERDESLGNIYKFLKETLKEAQKLQAMRDKLVEAHNKIMRRRAILSAVRSASVITLPFLPLASALFSAIDIGMSVSNGVQESFVSDEELVSTTQSVDSLQATLVTQIEWVEGIRVKLRALIAKIEEQVNDSIAHQVLYLLAKLNSTRKIVEAVFDRSATDWESVALNDAPSDRRSLRAAVQAMHAVLPNLGLPVSADVSLASLRDEAWRQIEVDLLAYKQSPN